MQNPPGVPLSVHGRLSVFMAIVKDKRMAIELVQFATMAMPTDDDSIEKVVQGLAEHRPAILSGFRDHYTSL